MTRRSAFDPLPTCPFFCAGVHDGSSDTVHSTLPGGPFGDYVVVGMTDGGVPDVRLTDVPHPELIMTSDEARLLSCQLWMGAGLVDRYTFPLDADRAERTLRRYLEQRGVVIE